MAHIYDIHIVRIKDHDEETAIDTADLWLPVDADSYPPVPKKISVPTLVQYIKNETLRALLCVKDETLRADLPVNVVFDTEQAYDYEVFWRTWGADGQVGIEITNATSTGFTIMAVGADCQVSYFVIPIIPLV